MPDETDPIQIFLGLDSLIPSPDVNHGLSEKIESVTLKESEVAVSTLRENMCPFLTSLDTIMSASPKDVDGLTLEGVEIHAQTDLIKKCKGSGFSIVTDQGRSDR